MSVSGLSPAELVEICVTGGSPAAWQEFVRRFQPLVAAVVVRTARRWGEGSAAVVEDLVQEVYLKLCANRCQLLRQFESRHPDAIYGFLKVMAANVVMDHFRSQTARKRSVPTANPEALDTVAAPGTDPERRILLTQIDSVLKTRLPEANRGRDRTVFWLYYRQGLTAKAIAAIPAIGLNVKGVESLILRITQMVRAAVTAWPDPCGEQPAKAK